MSVSSGTGSLGSPGQRAIKVVVVTIEQDKCEGAIKRGCLSAETVFAGLVCVCAAGRQLD